MARTSHQSTGLSYWRRVAFALPPLKLFNQGYPVSFRIPGLSRLVTHVFVLGNLLAGGIKFIVDTLSAIVYARHECEMALRNRLLDGQRRLERGEIDAAEFAQIERQVMTSLRLLRRGY